MQLWSLNPVGAYVCIFMYFCVLCKYILCGQAAVVSMNRSGTSISLSLSSVRPQPPRWMELTRLP